jgi:prevent-host-death family protein
MKTYTYTEARQQLAGLLDEATREGEVRIRRRDGRLFVVQPMRSKRSPLDVPAVETDVTLVEILDFIREGREAGLPNKRLRSTTGRPKPRPIPARKK